MQSRLEMDDAFAELIAEAAARGEFEKSARGFGTLAKTECGLSEFAESIVKEVLKPVRKAGIGSDESDAEFTELVARSSARSVFASHGEPSMVNMSEEDMMLFGELVAKAALQQVRTALARAED